MSKGGDYLVTFRHTTSSGKQKENQFFIFGKLLKTVIFAVLENGIFMRQWADAETNTELPSRQLEIQTVILTS